MNYHVNEDQIKSFQQNGYIVIEDFLSAEEELAHWRKTIMHAVTECAGIKMPGKNLKTGEDDGINEHAACFGKVIDQLLNLWQTDYGVKS